MSTVRIKFLDRVKILQQHVVIRTETQGKARRFSIELELSSYKFEPSCEVIVEARTLLETLRFKLGTIGGGLSRTPKDISRLQSERITFNLLVVDPNTARKVGSAQAVRPTQADGKPTAAESLLPVDLSDDTGGLLWNVRFEDSDADGHTDAPVLVFAKNAARGSAAVFVKDAAVRAMVFPAALKAILTKILVIDEHAFAPDGASWRDAWLRFAAQILGDVPPDREPGDPIHDVVEWIEKAVQALAERGGFLDAYVQEVRL